MNVIVPIILILSSFGIFFGYINPAYTAETGSTDLAGKSIRELQSVDQDYTDALGKTSEIDKIREGLVTKFNTLPAENAEKILKLLPDHIDSVRLIIDTNNIASSYGMSLSDIKLFANSIVDKNNTNNTSSAGTTNSGDLSNAQQVGPNSSLYDSVKLSFSISGPYDNFRQFLSELQRSLRIVDITSISFDTLNVSVSAGSSKGSSSISEIYKYSVTLRTYFLK